MQVGTPNFVDITHGTMSVFYLPRTHRNSYSRTLLALGQWVLISLAFLLTFLLCFSLQATAQWSTDPANPLAVCNEASDQTSLRALSDGNGGWYAFWIDIRTDGVTGEIYGQHLDADGYSQWTPNGKLLVSIPDTSIKELAPVLLDNGNVLINYIFGPSVFKFSLHAMAFDPAGDPVWSQPTVLEEAGTTMLGFDQVTAIPANGGAHVGWYDNFIGGSNLVNVSRINNDGTLPWGAGGHSIADAFYGPFELHPDGANGLMVQWRTGNGTGAALFAMRVDANGASAWPLNVQTSANSPGLNYGFHTAEMGAGAQVTAWRDVPGNIMMARLDPAGLLTYPASPMPVCTYTSYHDLPRLAVSNGTLFAAWADNRPPAANGDVYLQKFGTDGQPLWTVDGLSAIHISTNYTTPGLVASDSGAVIAMTDGNMDGYVAMRKRPDGTPAWSALGTFCTFDFRPFYGERIEMPDGDGGVVSFWRTWTGDLHAARIIRTGFTAGSTTVFEQSGIANVIAYPNPAQDRVSFNTGNERVVRAEVFDGFGRSQHADLDGATLDVQHLAQGIHHARLVCASGRVLASIFIKQ